MRVAYLITFLGVLLIGCSSENSHEGSLDWDEADAFHKILANTYHPMEEGDMQAVYNNAGELAAKAREWVNSEFPEEFDNTEFRNELFSLVVESQTLADLVDTGVHDDSVARVVNRIHDRFHKIEERIGNKQEGN